MKYQRRAELKQSGFTIIELMIATAVLSTILLLVTVIMISIGNLYYKGINQSRTQDDVRSITDQVAQDLKLNSGTVTTGSGFSTTLDSEGSSVEIFAYCIGNVRYSYVTGYKVGASGSGATDTIPAGESSVLPVSPHVLWRDSGGTGSTPVASPPYTSSCIPADVTNSTLSGSNSSDPGGIELMAPDSRLTAFSIGPSSSPYNIVVGVAYGDIDLLSGYSIPGLNQNPLNANTVLCAGGTGDQFCSTASLSTTVSQRILPGN